MFLTSKIDYLYLCFLHKCDLWIFVTKTNKENVRIEQEEEQQYYRLEKGFKSTIYHLLKGIEILSQT